MTAEEFEQQYAERSGLTVEKLRELGRVVRSCDCGEDICEGWQSINKVLADELEEDFRLGIGPRPPWVESE